MLPRSVVRLALATLLLSPLAGVSVSPAAAAPCVSEGDAADPIALILFQDSLFDPPLQQPDTPSPSCDSQRKECLSGSAQTGIYGERYVPPEAVAMCMEQYRACTAAQPAE
ncbi:hypothetical protein [Mycolicibacterium austroafricanum]|uniref:hypothetical protein n=1 Tax=Mycolicibacterium austroafricanum TaxID=39687 RepID=UPI001CA34344|nr:hypothetical protein [Mycolicibacterium austroafricanum]QZT61476.1 hypothetical protein JN085_21235 [Mycolicibacterium austroafricanum]